MTIEMVSLYGVKGGVETLLGSIPMPVSMKINDLARDYFMGNPEDEDSDSYMAACMCAVLVDWLEGQGWVRPPYALKNP